MSAKLGRLKTVVLHQLLDIFELPRGTGEQGHKVRPQASTGGWCIPICCVCVTRVEEVEAAQRIVCVPISCGTMQDAKAKRISDWLLKPQANSEKDLAAKVRTFIFC